MRIFVSYSRKDAGFATGQLVPRLRHIYGHDNIMYDADLHGGQAWWDALLTKIAACDVFLPVLSAPFNESDYCQRELDEAFRLKKSVLPVLIGDESTIPSRLRHIQVIPLGSEITTDSLAEVQRALVFIQADAVPPVSKSRPALPMRGSSRITVLLASAGLLIVVGGLAFFLLRGQETPPLGRITSLQQGETVPSNLTIQGAYDHAQVGDLRLWLFVSYHNIYYPQCEDGCCTGSHMTVSLNPAAETWQTGAIVGMPDDSGRQFGLDLMLADIAASEALFSILDGQWCPEQSIPGLSGEELRGMGFTPLDSISVMRR